MPEDFMNLSSHQVARLSLTALLIFATTQAANAAPKVGSPEWKREFDRKMKEHDRRMANFDKEFDAKQKQFQQQATVKSSRSNAMKSDPNFKPANAPSPLDCLLAFRKAASKATSAEQLLPYRAKILRENYRLSQSWGSDYDHLQHDKDMLLGIVRVDDIRIQGDKAKIQVVNSCKRGSYTVGTFTMKGEGNRWRMEAYKPGNYFYSHMPSPPKHKSREKRDFPIYLERYLARLKSADQQQTPKDPPKEEAVETTAQEPPEPPPAS